MIGRQRCCFEAARFCVSTPSAKPRPADSGFARTWPVRLGCEFCSNAWHASARGDSLAELKRFATTCPRPNDDRNTAAMAADHSAPQTSQVGGGGAWAGRRTGADFCHVRTCTSQRTRKVEQLAGVVARKVREHAAQHLGCMRRAAADEQAGRHARGQQRAVEGDACTAESRGSHRSGTPSSRSGSHSLTITTAGTRPLQCAAVA